MTSKKLTLKILCTLLFSAFLLSGQAKASEPEATAPTRTAPILSLEMCPKLTTDHELLKTMLFQTAQPTSYFLIVNQPISEVSEFNNLLNKENKERGTGIHSYRT